MLPERKALPVRVFVKVLLRIIIRSALSLSKGASWFDKLTTNGFADF